MDALNSQRVSIIVQKFSKGTSARIFTTNLLRWTTNEREGLFANLKFAEVTGVANKDNLPKIGNPRLVKFWTEINRSGRTLRDISKSILSETSKDETSEWFLIVPRAVRYFLSAFPVRVNRNKVLTMTFHDKQSRDLAMVLINSNIHYWYWLSYGDGFLTNVDVLAKFPTPDLKEKKIEEFSSRLYRALDECVTYQSKQGELIPNYNFNKRMDILLDIDEFILREIVPDLNLPRDIFAQYKSISFLQPINLAKLISSDETEVLG